MCVSVCFGRLRPKQWHPNVPPGCVRLTLAVIGGRIPRAGTATQRKCLFSLTDLNAIWLSVANSVVLIQKMISPKKSKKEGSKDSYFIHHFSNTSCCSAGGLTATSPIVTGFAERLFLCCQPKHTHLWFTWWSHVSVIQLQAVVYRRSWTVLGKVSFIQCLLSWPSDAYSKQNDRTWLERGD